MKKRGKGISDKVAAARAQSHQAQPSFVPKADSVLAHTRKRKSSDISPGDATSDIAVPPAKRAKPLPTTKQKQIVSSASAPSVMRNDHYIRLGTATATDSPKVEPVPTRANHSVESLEFPSYMHPLPANLQAVVNITEYVSELKREGPIEDTMARFRRLVEDTYAPMRLLKIPPLLPFEEPSKGDLGLTAIQKTEAFRKQMIQNRRASGGSMKSIAFLITEAYNNKKEEFYNDLFGMDKMNTVENIRSMVYSNVVMTAFLSSKDSSMTMEELFQVAEARSDIYSAGLPTFETVDPLYNQDFLRAPCPSRKYERPCVRESICVGQRVIPGHPFREFLLPSELETLKATGKLPEKRSMCLPCTRFFYTSHVIMHTQTNAHNCPGAHAASMLPVNRFVEKVGDGGYDPRWTLLSTYKIDVLKPSQPCDVPNRLIGTIVAYNETAMTRHNHKIDTTIVPGTLPLGSSGSTRKHHVLLGSLENAIKRNASPGTAIKYNEWVQDSAPVAPEDRFTPSQNFIKQYCQHRSHDMDKLFSSSDVSDWALETHQGHCCLQAPVDPIRYANRLTMPLYVAMTRYLQSLRPIDRLNNSSVCPDCPVYRFFYKDIPTERVLMDRAIIGSEETIPLAYIDKTLEGNSELDEISRWRNETDAIKSTSGNLTHVPSFNNPMRLLRQLFYNARLINGMMEKSTSLKEELAASPRTNFINYLDILLSSFERTSTLLHNHLVRIASDLDNATPLSYPMNIFICPTKTAKKLGDDFHITHRFFHQQICRIDPATGECTASGAEHAQNIIDHSLNFAYSIFWNIAFCEVLQTHLQEYEDELSFSHPLEYDVSFPSKLSDEKKSRIDYNETVSSDLTAIRQAKYLIFSKNTTFIPLLTQMILYQKWNDSSITSTPHRSLLTEHYPSCEAYINAEVLPSTSNTYFMAISGLCSSMKHLSSVWSAMVHLLGKMQIVGKCTSRAIYTAVSKRSHEVPIIHMWTMWLIFMCLIGGYETSKMRQKMGMCMSLYTNFILFMPSISGAAIFEKCQYLLQHSIRYFMFYCTMKEGIVWDVYKRTQKRHHELYNLLCDQDEYIRRSIAEIGMVTTEDGARQGAVKLIYRVEKTLKDYFNKEVREHYEDSRRSLTFASAMCSKMNQIIIKLSEDAVEEAEGDAITFQQYGIQGKIETQSGTHKNEINFQTNDGRDLFFRPILPDNFDEAFLDKLALASARRTDVLVYFSQLTEVGMTPKGVKKFGRMMMRWVSLGMFENALIAKCRGLLEQNPADFFIAFIYLRKILKCMTCYTINLSREIAMKQIRAVRAKISLEPWTQTPEYAGVAIICEKHGHLNPVIDGPGNGVDIHHVHLSKYYYSEEGRICCSGEDMSMTNNIIPNNILDGIPDSDIIMRDIQTSDGTPKKTCNTHLKFIDMIGKVLCNDGVMTAICSKCGCICRVHNENFYTDEVTCLNHGEVENAPGFNYSDIATSSVLGNVHLTPVTGKNECRICGKPFDKASTTRKFAGVYSVPVIGFSGNIEWIRVCHEHHGFLVNINGKNMHTLRNLDKVIPTVIESAKMPQLTQMMRPK